MGSSDSLRIVLADDHELFRFSLSVALEREADVHVVADCGTMDEAIQLVESRICDVLLVDIEMPGVPIRTALSRLRRSSPEVRVIVVSMHRDSVLSNDLIAAGASAYVDKSSPASVLIGAIRGNEGRSYAAPTFKLLTHREREVLVALGLGLSNDEIAARLLVTAGTVKRHTHAIYGKLSVRSRVQAVRKAHLLGLL